MTLILYRNDSEPERLDKSLATIYTMTGTLRNETSIIDPVIIVEAPLENLTHCNYLEIPDFSRKYFITGIKSIRAGLVEITAHVDVLSTYAQQIRANKAIVRRQENRWNLYLNDGSFRVFQNPIIATKKFPNGFSSPELVLAVAGK